MFRRVVIPLDGSALAEGILPFIMEIAGPLDLEVVLLRVVPPVSPDVFKSSRHVVIDDPEARRQEAEAYLAGIRHQLAGRGVRARVMVRRGDAVREIVDGAREVGADLIAMTTHGRSGLGRLLFGSVAEAVLRHGEIPVFLMRLIESRVLEGGVR